ncbi:hypothetical protein [Halorussus sp. AFM4]|uniref:hypothetical protein n=1 Tax=Halorussus sp. AFM4 TaxID=3421651 RepID=UPI003EBCA345
MPSRRRLLAALGTTAAGALAGCSASDATTGVVARKDVTVAVPQDVGDPVDTTVAFLAFESESRLVHGEYAHVAGAAVDGATIAVSEQLHERLSDRFTAVRYTTDVVPADGSKPADGAVDRWAFNDLSVGGTATVESSVGDAGRGRLRLRETTARERDPAEITVSAYDLEARLDG